MSQMVMDKPWCCRLQQRTPRTRTAWTPLAAATMRKYHAHSIHPIQAPKKRTSFLTSVRSPSNFMRTLLQSKHGNEANRAHDSRADNSRRHTRSTLVRASGDCAGAGTTRTRRAGSGPAGAPRGRNNGGAVVSNGSGVPGRVGSDGGAGAIGGGVAGRGGDICADERGKGRGGIRGVWRCGGGGGGAGGDDGCGGGDGDEVCLHVFGEAGEPRRRLAGGELLQ